MEQNINKNALMVLIGIGFASGLGGAMILYYLRGTNPALNQELSLLRQDVMRYQQHALGAASAGAAGEVCDWSTLRTKLRDTVVQVFAHKAEFNWLEPYKAPEQGGSRGSAFFISTQGDLISNAHVVDQARGLFIQIPSQGKRQFAVDLIGVSFERDLALLRLKPQELAVVKQALGEIPMLTFADSDLVRGSEELMTLGYPLGQQSLKGTTGITSGRERIGGQYMIQISAPINPGNSGGPSVNRCGEVIGVNTSSILFAQNVNYIIPSNEVRLFLQNLEQLQDKQAAKQPEKTGTATAGAALSGTAVAGTDASAPMLVRKGSLGLIYGTASDELTAFLGNPLPGGLYVTDVCPGSIVADAGLRPGDMIYEINGHPLDIFGEMHVAWSEDKVGVVDYISRLMYGDIIKLKLFRKGSQEEISFPFGLSQLAPIRRMYPGYEAIDYEMVGGMVIMQLSVNILQLMAAVIPELAWFLDVRHQMEPVLIITHLLPDSVVTRARVISAGTIITEANGKKVQTLADLRAALEASVDTGSLILKTKDDILAVFPFIQMLTEEEKLARNFGYMVTPCVSALNKKAQERLQELVQSTVVKPTEPVVKPDAALPQQILPDSTTKK